jgi:hypothetical protein
MQAGHVRTYQATAERDAPPRWTAITVRACVIGLVVLPLLTPVVLAARGALGTGPNPFHQAGFLAAAGIWLAMFACAQLLTTVYPPAARR